MFRGHHVERVVQVESTLNKVAACEQEKAQLYTEMRFRAQRREQEKKPNHFLQELEETKAFLNGLNTALEFIQTEQENLVERVMAADELKAKIEAIGKASRAAEQKVVSWLFGVAICYCCLVAIAEQID
jgi:phage-related minor tail protein